MSGRRIDDHKSWMGGKSKASVFPEGVKIKEEHSAEGAGKLPQYDDTTEAIHRDQQAAHGKINSKPMKPGYRY
jgi:hypothetical protein